MSKSIDEHVVGMRFENKAFESGVSKSLTTIEKLKKSLNFKGMSDGLTDVSNSANKMDFSGAVKGVETLKNRFSIMGAVAFTIIQGITRKLMALASQMARTLIFEPITSGLSEYETQINAIQTILANTSKDGTDLAQVSDALSLLNTYADQTIYNFTQMTRNIGTFTAAGISLQTSVDAIKGIANLAAVSGSTSQQASTAMYQMSQALSTGTMKLQDWNSVVNAGMGGAIFKDALIETARLHGIAIDQMVEDEGSFRSTLSKGWLSSEILTDTLKKFTGDLDEATLMQQGYTQTQAAEIVKLGIMANDAATKVKTLTQLGDTLKEAAQSGWTRSWELIIGDFDQAKEFLTGVSEVLGELIGQSADARNEILEGWGELGGRAYMIDKLWAAFYNLQAIMKPVKDAFSEIFPPMTAQTLINLTLAFGRLVDNFKIGAVGAANIKKIFSGLFALLDIGKMAFVAIVKAILPLGENLSGFGDGLLDVALSVSTYFLKIRDAIKTYGFIIFYESFLSFLDRIKEKISALTGIDFGELKNLFSDLSLDMEPLKKSLSELSLNMSPLTFLWETLLKVMMLLGSIVKALMPIMLKLGEAAVNGLTTFFDTVTGTLGDFDSDTVFKAINGGLFAGILLAVRSFIKNGSDALEGVADILDGVGGSLQAWQNSLNAKALLNIAFALGILALSLVLIASIDPVKLAGALGALSILLLELFASIRLLTAGSSGASLALVSIGLIGLSIAILILAAAMKVLSTIDPEDMAQALGTVTSLLIGLVAATKVLSKSSGQMITASVGLLILAGALLLLSVAIFALGSMDVNTLNNGLLSIGALLAGLALYTRLSGGPSKIISTSIAIGILAGALLLLSVAIFALGSIDVNTLNNGLKTMGAALLIILIAMNSLPENMMVKSIGLVAVATAMLILSEALKTMGGMSLEKIGNALMLLGGSLLILAVGLRLMSGTLIGSAALLVASGALIVLSEALKTLGSMSLSEIGLALLALVGILVIFGIAGLVLGPIVPILMSLAVALLTFGAAILLAGIGVYALAVGLGLLATTGGPAIAIIVLALTALFKLIPVLVEQLGIALIELIKAIAAAAPELVKAVVEILKALILAFVEIVPFLVEAVLDLIISLLSAIAGALPEIVQAGFDILLALLQGIADNIGDVVTTVADIVMAFVDALALKLPEIVDSGFGFLIAFIDGMTAGIEEHLPNLLESFFNMGIALLEGLTDGLLEKVGQALVVVKEIALKILYGFLKAWGIESPSTETYGMAKYLMLGIVGGIKTYGVQAITAASKMGDDLMDALSVATGTISDILDSDLDTSLVITPVLDLTDFSEGTNVMSKAMDNLDTTVAASTAASMGSHDTVTSDMENATVEPVISFTQYNNSPKALSRLEIYRQTRLLLEAA